LARKRQAKEREKGQVSNMNSQQLDDWSELQSVLDRELTGLPKKYRVPIVLCDLEGKTRKEAASLLHLPEGTLSTRLARGRALLARRLTRLGISLTSGSFAGILGQNASASVSSSLVQTTVEAGALFAAGQIRMAGIISPTVLALMKGVMKTMSLTKLKVATAVVFTIGVIGTANLMVYYSMAVEPAQVSMNELPFNQDGAPPRADETPKKDKQREEKQNESAKPGGEESKDEKAHGLPGGPAPYWVCASIAKDGKIIVGIPVITYKTVTTKIKKDGEEKEAYYYEPVAKENVKSFEPGDVKGFDVQGKPMDSKDLAKLLEKKTLVLCSTDSRKVDAFYLRIIKDGTVVLVISKPLWDGPVGYAPALEPPRLTPQPQDSPP
jgi:hypothetical protein